MDDGGHGAAYARGNIRAGNKFYLAGADLNHLAEFDPMTETYTIIDTVMLTLEGIIKNILRT